MRVVAWYANSRSINATVIQDDIKLSFSCFRNANMLLVSANIKTPIMAYLFFCINHGYFTIDINIS